MRIQLAQMRDCERGASVIEMALAAPFLAALLLGMADLSRAYSDRLALEQAAQRTIEKVAQQRSVSSNYDALKYEAAAAAGVSVTSGNPSVDYWLECSSDGGATWVRQGNGSPGNGFGGSCPSDTDLHARYVTITIQKNFTPAVSSGFLGANQDGTYTLTGRAGVRVQ